MKFRVVVLIAAMTLLAAAPPVRLAAQDKQDHKKSHKHHHYQFIDMGTFGGPTSVNFAIYPAINNEGTVIGMADTTTPDPFYPNDILLTPQPDPYIFAAFQSQNGQIVSLDSLPGGYSAYPGGISENGLIAGEAINGTLDPIGGWPESRAVFWRGGQIVNLGTLGGDESFAGTVNRRGQVTGTALNAVPDPYSIFYSFLFGLGNGTQTRAFLWDEKHGMQDLGSLGGPDAFSQNINERGEVAGFSYTSSNPNPSGFPTIDPFLWEPPTGRYPNGKMIDLGTLGGTFGGEGDGVALNNRGQVVGSSNLDGDVYFHPFLWSKPGPMRDLGTFGGDFGTANAINDAGEVVGWASNAGDQAVLAFSWKDGTLTNLGVLPGKLCSYAHQINSKDQVTGSSDDDCNDGGGHAFLWENGGPMVDLNDLVIGADMILGGATGINDRGEITGTGVLANGDTHIFLLIPCDEHHPGIEGCDYSMVEVPQASSALASTRPPVSLSPAARAMMLHESSRALGFGRRAMRAVLSPQAEETGKVSGFALPEELMPLKGEEAEFVHHGACEVNQSTGKLTGYCQGPQPPYHICEAGASKQCPVGKRARKPGFTQCGEGPPSYIDFARACTF